MPSCQYKYKSDHPEDIEYTCEEPSIPNGEYCIFHDRDHYAEYKQEAIKRFEEKLRESISQNKPLECVGYFLPGINFSELLKGKKFSQEVYFSNATFYGKANFSQVKFSEQVNFFEARFSQEAMFSYATFDEETTFMRAKFYEKTIFYEVRFSKLANFFEAIFFKDVNFFWVGFSDANFNRSTFSKEVKFYEASFSDKGSFWFSKFLDKANFARAAFSKEANFSQAIFSGKTFFSLVTFSKEVNFSDAKFSGEANFSYSKFMAEVYFMRSKFADIAFFRYATFEQPNKALFDANDLSKVSFAYSDITRIRFGGGITWGGDDEFTLIEEKWLKDKTKNTKGVKVEPERDVRLELVLSVYRNLRENYEFRLRYDDAGKFFIKEMELKRRYREIELEGGHEVKKNGWLRRHFSLTGLYYHLSRYGESIARPTLIGAITLVLSTLFWVTQSNPILEPNFSFLSDSTNAVVADNSSTVASNYVGSAQFGNGTQWLKAFERSFADFLPLLPLGDFKVGIIDYVIKIVGGALTFGLLAIALRRKFERKYTR